MFLEHLRNLPSITTFENELNSDIKKIPKFYFAGKRLGQIYHSRLRRKCSSLNQHLFSKNIVDSSLCVCGTLEDTNHFLFNFGRFHNLRQELFNKLIQICQHILDIHFFLVANNFRKLKNRQIFLAVQEFLVKSKLFEIA